MLEEPLQPVKEARWGLLDLGAFAVFFVVTLLSVQFLFFLAIRHFGSNLQSSVVAAVVVQGIIDLIVVGFIFFLVRVVHGLSFKDTIHWYPQHQFTRKLLVSLGTGLAVAVLLTSAFFPQTSQTPIEKLLSSAGSLYIFAIFGILVAPLFEEIIFRGFLFKVFSDMGGRAVAIRTTAVLFALLHAVQLWGNWAAVALIFVVGFVLAVVRDRSGSLIPGLIVHTAYNSTLFGMYAISTLVAKYVKPGGP